MKSVSCEKLNNPINIKDVPEIIAKRRDEICCVWKKSDGLIKELTTSAGVPAHLLSKNNPALVKRFYLS